MERLRRRLSARPKGDGGRVIADNDGGIGSAHRFVTESLPYMRTILPQGEQFSAPFFFELMFFIGTQTIT